MRRQKKRAQTVLEFAMLAPIFFILLTAVFDFARAAYTWADLSYAAREGAREAVIANFASTASKDSDVFYSVTSQTIGLTVTRGACPHGTTAGATAAPTSDNTGYAYILGVSPSTVNAPAAQPVPPSPAYAAGCALPVPATTNTYPIKVRIIYKFVPFTPFASDFMSGGIVMQADAVMYTEF